MGAVNIDVDPEAESFQRTSQQNLRLGSSIAAHSEAVVRIIIAMLPSIVEVTRDWMNRFALDKVNGITFIFGIQQTST
jgi:hypothetical protein